MCPYRIYLCQFYTQMLSQYRGKTTYFNYKYIAAGEMNMRQKTLECVFLINNM